MIVLIVYYLVVLIICSVQCMYMFGVNLRIMWKVMKKYKDDVYVIICNRDIDLRKGVLIIKYMKKMKFENKQERFQICLEKNYCECDIDLDRCSKMIYSEEYQYRCVVQIFISIKYICFLYY